MLFSELSKIDRPNCFESADNKVYFGQFTALSTCTKNLIHKKSKWLQIQQCEIKWINVIKQLNQENYDLFNSILYLHIDNFVVFISYLCLSHTLHSYQVLLWVSFGFALLSFTILYLFRIKFSSMTSTIFPKKENKLKFSSWSDCSWKAGHS